MKSPWLTVCVVAAVAFLWMSEAQPDEPGKAAPPFADSMRGKAPGEVRDDNGLKMKLVWCSPGFVTMEQVEQVQKPAANAEQADGDDPEDKSSPEGLTATKVTPVKVLLSRGYWLGRYEVTQSEWKEVMKTEPWNGQAMIREGHDYPATCVNWNDAMEFCGKLTEHERKAGRLPADWEYTLPTEAQWERACRARTETNFSFGDDESKLGEYAWTVENARNFGEDFIHQVGQKKPNPWGFYDMHGNAWEWCRDVYSEKLARGRDPIVTGDGPLRSVRSGGFNSPASNSRSAFRGKQVPDNRWSARGFRVALIAVQQAKLVAPGADAPRAIDK